MDFTQELQELRESRRSPRFSGAAALSPLLSLDRSTLLDRLVSDQPAQRRLILRYFKKAQIVQTSWGIYKPEQKKSGGRTVTAEEYQANQDRATRRATANIRRDLLTIGADRMVTLTYRENIQDRQRALKHLEQFVRIMRRMFTHWNSVTVLEYQQRGAIHFHIGVSGYYDAHHLRQAWQSIVGSGNVDIAFRPDGRGNPCAKLASYMAKYLAKDCAQGRKDGEHRYFRTQGIERPREVYYIPDHAPDGEERELSLEIIKKILGTGGVCPTLWSPLAGLRSGGFMCGERNH